MIFSWTISIGTIVEVVTIALGGALFIWSMRARIEGMGQELSSLKQEISKLADILTKLAVQDQRILAIEKDVDELRHGTGYVVKPPAFRNE